MKNKIKARLSEKYNESENGVIKIEMKCDESTFIITPYFEENDDATKLETAKLFDVDYHSKDAVVYMHQFASNLTYDELVNIIIDYDKSIKERKNEIAEFHAFFEENINGKHPTEIPYETFLMYTEWYKELYGDSPVAQEKIS